MTSVVIDNRQINLVQNNSASRTFNEHIIAFAGTSNAVFRCFQAAERITKLVIEALKYAGSTSVVFCQTLASRLLVAWTSTSILRLPDVTTKAVKALNDLKGNENQAPSYLARKAVKAVHDTAEAASMWGYSISFVLNSAGWKTAADVPDLIANSTDLQMSAQDWHVATQTAKQAAVQNSPAEVKEAIVHTQRNAFIRMMKAACSVAGGVLGLSFIAFGAPLLPAVVLITISLSATLLAMTSHFYQETCPYKMVDFFENRNVKALV